MSDLEATRRGAMAASGAERAVKTFVLVHGAWHGGWCWRRVADQLSAKGHKVYTPTLTGLCDRSHLLTEDIDVSTHATDIANLVRWEGLADIVLVGHSYGGFVVTEVAERIAASISSIVFLDAFLPAAGECLHDLGSPTAKKLFEDAKAKGETVIKPIPAAAFKVNEKDRAWVDAQCTPQPIATLLEKAKGIAGRESVGKRTYIRAAAYNSVSFDAGLAKARATPGWKTYEVASGHDVMIDMPERLVEILLEVA